jgi:glycine cleavage system H protein
LPLPAASAGKHFKQVWLARSTARWLRSQAFERAGARKIFLFSAVCGFLWLEYMSNVPSDLKYTKSHEWVRVNGDTATIGISDHAQHELTDIVFVELPDKGRKVKAGEACAVVESVKTASDIYSPLSGEIVEINQAVVDNPALANKEPHAGGWFFKIKLANPAELSALLSPEKYQAQIGG